MLDLDDVTAGVLDTDLATPDPGVLERLDSEDLATPDPGVLERLDSEAELEGVIR